jgi:pantoate--beta-alanine ligase
MGALHEGHASLIKQSVAENKMTIVSIFVNPTQFDNNKDLDKYPRTFESDISLIKEIDDSIIIFAPTATELYQGEVISKHYTFDGLEFEMEGKHREGHFDGVGTVLDLFFKLVAPKNAYFGKKDFQQLQIVKKLVENYNLNVNIIGCEIYRETSGLAMSSRNERLSSQAREKASLIYKVLQEAKEQFKTKSPSVLENWVENEFNNHKEFKLEYVSIADSVTLKPAINKTKNKNYRIFIAVFIENIRLIDNIALN